ncbi:MAG: GtrA family protein, partial [Silvibacterium sp.]
LLYCAVGTVGVAIHLLLLGSFLRLAGLGFMRSQALATLLVMMLNYALNNSVTWRDRTRRGWRFWSGMATYCLACLLGAAVNVAVSSVAAREGMPWALAGVTGLMFSAVWNYGVTSIVTWRHRHDDGGAKTRRAAAQKNVISIQPHV